MTAGRGESFVSECAGCLVLAPGACAAAPHRNRKHAAHGLLSFLSLLRAFQLNVIKRNQASSRHTIIFRQMAGRQRLKRRPLLLASPSPPSPTVVPFPLTADPIRDLIRRLPPTPIRELVLARARPLSSGVADCLCREKNKCASSRINQTQSAFACKSRSHLACPPHPPFAPPAHPADPRRKGAHSVFNTTIELIQNQTTLTFVFEHGNFRTRARVQRIAVLPRAPPSRICLMSTTRCAGNENSHCLADTFSRARRKRPGASARA